MSASLAPATITSPSAAAQSTSSPRRPIPLIWRRSDSLGAEEAMDSPGALARHLAFLQLKLADPDFPQHVLKHAGVSREQTHQLLNAAIEHGKLRRWDTRTLAEAIQVAASR